MFNPFKRKVIPDWSFQEDAIDALVRDFRSNQTGRFLLVLPTGGGKTLTAIRSLSQMYRKGILAKDDRVLWIVHTLALRSNAEKNLKSEKNYNRFGLDPILRTNVDVKMKTEASRILASGSTYKFLVIDEAHHAAADTYLEFFDYPVAILGLTATPSRMDDRSLPFERISYSITFRELVRRKVVLLPKFLPDVKTNITISSSSLDDEGQLEKFNSQERNRLVSYHLFQEAEKNNFKKVIIFAGTNAHVKRLYEVIRKDNENSKTPFAHVGYIYGGNHNDKNINNENYLDWHQKQESSVLINCKILNEGYDDPSIDTVVMATPTNSILYYLQCIGRVVRTPEDHNNAKAYVVEIVDKLPNITYRIDNRWLFCEISDYLEPIIHDVKSIWPIRPVVVFWKLFSLKAKLSDLSWAEKWSIIKGNRISLVLFNDVPYNKRGVWRIMSIPENDPQKIHLYNDLSENIQEYYQLNHDYLVMNRYPWYAKQLPMNNRVYRSSLFAALHRAAERKTKKQKVDSLAYLSIS